MCCTRVTCENAKVAVLTSSPREVAMDRIDWAKCRSISPQQDFQSHSPVTFLLLGYKPCHGKGPIHHNLLKLS